MEQTLEQSMNEAAEKLAAERIIQNRWAKINWLLKQSNDYRWIHATIAGQDARLDVRPVGDAWVELKLMFCSEKSTIETGKIFMFDLVELKLSPETKFVTCPLVV
jgi:hypothetical protein